MAFATDFTATILGCGSSGGVPRIGNVWGTCDPSDGRNRRLRCSLLIEAWHADAPGVTRVLIDTGCDLREQLLAAEVDRVDAVFYTHEHADHTHGIDDLRVLALHNRKRVDVYHSSACGARLREAFGYCFVSAPGSDYPPILNGHDIEADSPVEISGPGGSIMIEPFEQEHGSITSFGFRIGDFAYSCDLSGVPRRSHRAISDLETWILDALRPTPHPSHLSLPEALELIERFEPRRAILTNLHIDMDYAVVARTTPENVEPAFDGLRINFSVDPERYLSA